MPVVRFEGSDESIQVGKGANLRRSLMIHGFHPYHNKLETHVLNCRGVGLCGSCWVEVVEGEENLSPPSNMETLQRKFNPLRDLSKGRRLTCQTRVYGDITLRNVGKLE